VSADDCAYLCQLWKQLGHIPSWCRGRRGPKSRRRRSYGAGGRGDGLGASSDGGRKLGELEKFSEIYISRVTIEGD
jgi:hypothetical protein